MENIFGIGGQLRRNTHLAYPASPHGWDLLLERERVVSRARVRSGSRNVELALLAVPLSGRAADPARILEQLVREAA